MGNSISCLSESSHGKEWIEKITLVAVAVSNVQPEMPLQLMHELCRDAGFASHTADIVPIGSASLIDTKA